MANVRRPESQRERVKIRTLTADEVSVVYELSRKEKWACSLEHCRALYDLDPEFFIGTEDCATGTMVGVCCAVTVNEHLALVGPLITREGFRGKGYGARLLAAVMEKLGDRNIGLNSLEGNETLYRKPSFGSFKISSFKADLYFVPVAAVKENNLASEVELFLGKMTPDTMPEILEYDASVMPMSRRLYMERWLQMAALTGTVVLAKRDQRIVGYGAVYNTHNCESVGGLYANDINIAQALLKSLAQDLPDTSILKFRIPDVEDLREWREFLRSIKGEYQGSNTRMYTKCDVALPLHVTYSISNDDNAIM